MKAPARKTCTWHCAACNRHFHSVGAFDLHRRDGECHDPMTIFAHKGGMQGRLLLQVWTREGYCYLMPGVWKDGVRGKPTTGATVWQKYGSAYSYQREE